MRKCLVFFALIALAASVKAQTQTSKLNISADLVSRYVWRGLQLSSSPAIQPTISFSSGNLSLGAWGSYASNGSGTECDLFASYTTPIGLTFYLTDYFFPSDPSLSKHAGYFKDSSFNHTIEAGLGYTYKAFSIYSYYYLNKTNDAYLEASYNGSNYTLFIGAGNESYSVSSNFNVTNIGLKVFKNLSLTDKVSIKPFASFIINPNKEQVFLVAGVTLF
jgi:hypothetical protein